MRILPKFAYNESGQRIKKQDHTNNAVTWYVYDAGGQLMSVFDNGDGTLKLREQPVYAASRIGVYFKQGNNYQYELSDHLGTVRAVINRTKLSNGQADVVYYADYYPYGQVLRSAGTGWRYGYQGQYAEKDGETGWNAFEARNYDAAIGRWLSTDPAGQYHSPYVGMGNNPVMGVDPDGQWSWLGAFFRQAGSFLRGQGPSKLYKSGNEWGFNTTDGNGVISGRFTGEGDLVKEFVSDIPVIGPALLSGDRLSKGDYWGAAGHFGTALAEGFTLGLGSVERQVATTSGAVIEDFVVKNGSTAANRLGQQMHKAYKAADVLEGIRIKEFSLPSGKRIDFIDLENKIIYELKPNNPRALNLGAKQLKMYAEEVESIYGEGFKTVLEKY